MNFFPLECNASATLVAKDLPPELLMFVLAMAAVTLWWLFKVHPKEFTVLVKRFLLIVFSFAFLKPYIKAADTFIQCRLIGSEFEAFLRRSIAEYKGTDWTDGFFTALAVVLYVLIVWMIWAQEFKKPKDNPPPNEGGTPIRIRMSGDRN